MSNLRHRRAQRIRDLADMGKTRMEVAAELFMSYATVVNYGRQFGIKFRHASKGVGVDEDRADVMEAMFRAGKTLEEVGSVYGISRERVRQIISKYRGVIRDDGGQAVRAKIEKDRRRAEREAECYRKHGCSTKQFRELHRIGREMRDSGESVYRTPIGAFRNQKRNAIARGIAWNIKLWEWWSIWQQSGKWDERGRAADAYVMCRFRDEGGYEIGNVYIATLRHNSSVQPNNPYRTGHPDHLRLVEGRRTAA